MAAASTVAAGPSTAHPPRQPSQDQWGKSDPGANKQSAQQRLQWPAARAYDFARDGWRPPGEACQRRHAVSASHQEAEHWNGAPVTNTGSPLQL